MQESISIGDTFQTTLEVIRRNLATLGAMVFITASLSFGMAIAQGVLMNVVVPNMTPEDDPMAVLSGLAILVPFGLVAVVVTMVVYAVVQAAMTYAAVEHMAGLVTDPVSALGTASRSILGLLGAQLLVGIATVVGFFLCVVPGVLLALQYCVVMPVVLVERMGPIAAMSRSAELTLGNRTNIFLVFLVYGVCAFSVTMCVMMPILGAVVAAAVMSGDPEAMSNPFNPVLVLSQGVQAVFQAAMGAVGTTLVAVIYARLRGIRDGVDAEAFAQVFA